jgi:ribosome biogenesis GTPase A
MCDHFLLFGMVIADESPRDDEWKLATCNEEENKCYHSPAAIELLKVTDNLHVVAIVGAQRSGKSTFMNSLVVALSTTFGCSTNGPPFIVGHADRTTRGIDYRLLSCPSITIALLDTQGISVSLSELTFHASQTARCTFDVGIFDGIASHVLEVKLSYLVTVMSSMFIYNVGDDALHSVCLHNCLCSQPYDQP